MAWLAWIREQIGRKGLEMGTTTDPGSTGAKNILVVFKNNWQSYAPEANLVYTGPDQQGLHSEILSPTHTHTKKNTKPPHQKKGSSGRWSLHLSMS